MAITKKTGITGLSSRKEIRKIITLQLENALPELKKELGDDKFYLRLKKAVKALTKDFEGNHHVVEEEAPHEKAPVADKLPVKVKKAAAKKTIKKKAIKKQHPSTT